MRVLSVILLTTLSGYLLSCQKRPESYKIGELGKSEDYRVSITKVIQPAVNLPYIGENTLLYVNAENYVVLRQGGKEHTLSSKDMAGGGLGGLRFFEKGDKAHVIFWARYYDRPDRIVKYLFTVELDKKNERIGALRKITPEGLMPTADISVGNSANTYLLAWTDENAEGSIGVCYARSSDLVQWSLGGCIKGYVHPKVFPLGQTLGVVMSKCETASCEHVVYKLQESGLSEFQKIKTDGNQSYTAVSVNGNSTYLYTWGSKSFSAFKSSDGKSFEKFSDSSFIEKKAIQELVPVNTNKPLLVLSLAPTEPERWMGIDLNKPNLFLADLSSEKPKLIRLQRNREHLTSAVTPAVAVDGKGNIAVVWIDKRFLIPVPFVSFITADGKLYTDNPLEDPRKFYSDVQPIIKAEKEEFKIYYLMKEINMEKDDAQKIFNRPYFIRKRTLKAQPIQFTFEYPDKKSLEKAFREYAQARISGEERKYYNYFDPIFRLRVPYEGWKSAKADIKFLEMDLKEAHTLEHFGYVIYRAKVEFPEFIGGVKIEQTEKEYQSIDEAWIYLFGKWYILPRMPVPSAFFAEW